MTKRIYEAMTALIPLPAVMVSCQRPEERPNIITIAWTGIVCSEPPMLSISIRKNRYSHKIVLETGEFVVNMTTRTLAEATDICGVVSGKDCDKFKAAKLTALPASKVMAPLIAECPINLECQTRTVLHLGTHDMFVAEIVATQIDEGILDDDGKLDIARLDPLIYCPKAREYWAGVTNMVGKYGFMSPRIRDKSEGSAGKVSS